MSKDAVQYGFTNEPDATLYTSIDSLVKAAGIQDNNYRVVMALYIPPFQLNGIQSVLRSGKLVHEHKLFGSETPEIKNDKILAMYP
jgi:hypothetical protein